MKTVSPGVIIIAVDGQMAGQSWIVSRKTHNLLKMHAYKTYVNASFLVAGLKNICEDSNILLESTTKEM